MADLSKRKLGHKDAISGDIKGRNITLTIRSRLWLQRRAQAEGKSLSQIVTELIERHSARLVREEREAIKRLRKEAATP
jgi:hypothetical protein